MANDPSGGGPGAPGDWQHQLEALSRQYWSAWGEALRAAGASGPAPQPGPGWHDALDWWSRFAHGGRSEANDLAERFNAQARHWFGQMQQVAAQFAGRDAGAAQIADAWRKALGAAGENPFPEIFRAMRGQGLQGLEQWIEDASPWLDAWRREGRSWLSLPAFGIGREHQERLQALARAQVEYQEKNAAYNALMARAGHRAFELFEQKLAERAGSDRKLTSARALLDLWIDAAEEAYADIALSQEFRAVYGALVNAQMRLRSGIQKEVELACAQLGMPTRSEMDAAHRKVAELERALRRLRAELAAVAGGAGTRSAAGQQGGRPRARTAGAGGDGGAVAGGKEAGRTKAGRKEAATSARGDKRAGSPRNGAAPGRPGGKRAARAVSATARRTSPAALFPAGIATPATPSGGDDAAAPRSTGRSGHR